VKVAFCPMQEIIGYFHTKPLQGSLFAWIREEILNLPSITSITVHRSVLKNRKYGSDKNERKITDGEVKQVGVNGEERNLHKTQGNRT